MREQSQHPKWAVSLSALAVISFVASGCDDGRSSAPPASEPAAQKQRVSTLTQPDIEKLELVVLQEPHPQGNALLLATLSKNSEEAIKNGFFVIQPDPDDQSRDVVLNDFGKDGDEKAGDLVFTGVFNFDLNELDEQNKRILEHGGSVIVTRFDGRTPVATEEVKPIEKIQPGEKIPLNPVAVPKSVDFASSLVITDPGVVGDPTRTFDPCTGKGTPMGAWTFGHLFTEMVNPALTGNAPEDVALKWMESWLVDQEIHFASAVKRLGVIPFINDWKAAGGGVLDMKVAPFKLVAIVNRMDLHDAIGYGGGSSGETRFVYALMDSACNPLPFLVIFEYGNTARKCDEIRDLAKHWVNLSTLPIGSPTYNAALQDITDLVVTAGADPSKPNESALNQLRTNDFVFDAPWQLREFIIDKGSGFLVPDTVKRTPDESLDFTPQLAFAIDNNLPMTWPPLPGDINILDGSFDPLEFPVGTPIRAMASNVPFNGFCFRANLMGNSAISGPDARFEYSSNTCAGCHGGDRNASGAFTHIDQFGNLSPFLSGPHTEPDCMTGTPRTSDEPLRRQQELDFLANNRCERQAMLKSLKAVH